MRALVISDKVEPILYGPAINDRVGAVDLILSCGDLPFYYIEYIISMVNIRVARAMPGINRLLRWER
jgi:hypothetical protein